MRRHDILAWITAALCLAPALGCKGKAQGREQLPPASGPGAPPLPKLPEVTDPPAAAGGGEVAPSQGKTTGTLYAHAEAQLAPNATGVIAEMFADEGSRVKRGQVLFRLDARDAVLRRAQARAALDAASVNFKAAQVEYDRTKTLMAQNAVNRAQWDQVEARWDGARVGVEQAKVAVAMAEKAVADAAVRSPLDGVVTAKLKNVGETATMMPPSVVMIVQDQQTLDLRFRLPERSLASVKPGQVIGARFTALGVARDAVVARINPTVDSHTRTIELVAEIANADQALRPGLLAEIDLKGATP